MSFDDLLLEILDKFINGGKVDIEEYCNNYPEYKDAIHEKFRTAEFIKKNFEEEDLSGKRLGEYTILQELARGGMGIVFLGIQPALSRLTAIKVLPPSFAQDKETLKNFQDEARIIAKFSHPNIVPIYSISDENGLPYIAMGYVSGLSLKNVIEITKKNSAPKKLKASLIKDMLQAPPADKQDISQKSITLKRGVKFWEMSYYKFVATIGAEIGDALSYAHRNGIIHGDIKPSNILLTNEAIPMVVDFGLSRNIKDMASAKSSEFSGTLAYAAPEQIKDNTSNEKTDIWSLGVTLYELLTLKNPFANKTIKKTADNILRGNPVPLRTYSKKIPAELEAIVLKCLEGDPANRYATIADLSSDLVNYIELRPIKAKRYGIVKRLQKAVKRKPALAFLYVFLIVLLPLIFVLMANNVLSNMVGSSHPAHRGGSVAQAIETEKMLIKILTFYPFARGYLADNYNNLGYYYMIHDTRHSSDYEKASEYYKKCLSLYPKGTKKKSLREADIYYQSYAALALIYASTGSYAESTEMFKACYRANPTFQPLPQWIAYLLYKQGVKNCSDQNIVEHFKKLGLSDPVDRKIMLAICTELELSRAREKEVELMNQSLRDRGIAD